jgi:hypothetical protein
MVARAHKAKRAPGATNALSAPGDPTYEQWLSLILTAILSNWFPLAGSLSAGVLSAPCQWRSVFGGGSVLHPNLPQRALVSKKPQNALRLPY